ncbi:rCG27519 [Rattus norvegicus]|uniref:RCG27519 n=1 Tax=Rattus norvegicus TaxID=10116 RepID=A6K7B0_RAT|nr:rCG27519 [Rattus norvegicus]
MTAIGTRYCAFSSELLPKECTHAAQPSANFWSREKVQRLSDRLDSSKVSRDCACNYT